MQYCGKGQRLKYIFILFELMESNFYSKFILDPNFDDIIKDLNKKNIHANNPKDITMDKSEDYNANSDSKLQPAENFHKIKLDPILGEQKTIEYKISAYDESMVKIPALEGSGFFISHSLVTMGKDSYIPLIYLTFNFYTRSRSIADGNNSLIFVNDSIDIASKVQYISDRNKTLITYTPDSSILLIDGPLIGGQITNYNMRLNQSLLKRNILPIYFVKNSDSSLIIDNISDLKDKYNSDFEWAFKKLELGERTALFKYTDLSDPIGNKKKFFTYMKAFNAPPCRVEMDETSYIQFHDIINDVFNAIFYLLLAQGNPSNPQPRPIAIAETYAREALKIIDFDEIINRTGIRPTMNYTRFGW